MIIEEKFSEGGLEEILEEWDWEAATPTGRPVSRIHAHKTGAPHEGVHLWVARLSPAKVKQILFQKRSPHKISYPCFLDITVGGHVPFSHQNSGIAKEALEEIGMRVNENGLTPLGLIRYEESGHDKFHREFQRVFITRDDRPLDAYRFTDGEVTGLCAVGLAPFESLFSGESPIEAEFFDGKKIFSTTVGRKDFHPELFAPSMRCYMEMLIPSLKKLFASDETGSDLLKEKKSK